MRIFSIVIRVFFPGLTIRNSTDIIKAGDVMAYRVGRAVPRYFAIRGLSQQWVTVTSPNTHDLMHFWLHIVLLELSSWRYINLKSEYLIRSWYSCPYNGPYNPYLLVQTCVRPISVVFQHCYYCLLFYKTIIINYLETSINNVISGVDTTQKKLLYPRHINIVYDHGWFACRPPGDWSPVGTVYVHGDM